MSVRYRRYWQIVYRRAIARIKMSLEFRTVTNVCRRTGRPPIGTSAQFARASPKIEHLEGLKGYWKNCGL